MPNGRKACAGVTQSRFCASGLESVNLAAAKVASGFEDLVVGGGVESMSRWKMGSDGGAWAMDPRINDKLGFVPQGIGADLIATMEGFSRTDVDTFALNSHKRAAAARAAGHFKRAVMPVTDIAGLPLLDRDETIRDNASLEAMAKLEASFITIGQMGFDATALRKYTTVEKINHVHHAGNSSGIVDGAALMLVGSQEGGKKAGLKARARIRAAAVIGSEPTIMLTGPTPACRKALAKAGMDGQGHRPLRDQRGLRRGADADRAQPRRGARPRQRERRRHRDGPPARRHRLHHPRHACSTSSSAAT